MARNGVSELMPDELKPYLTYSLGVHFVVALAALRLLPALPSSQSGQTYTIDFVGPSAMIQSNAAPGEAAQAAQASASKPAADSEFDEFGRRKGKGFSLPRPSFLRGFQAPAPEKQESRPTESAPTAGGSAASGSGTASSNNPGAGIETDMPNFPYPWYISQVRAGLWSQWQNRMPKEAGQCVIVFSILPNGGIVDLRAEESSGDSAFDLTAMSAVQDAAPFPSLPKGFNERFLKIHVTLRSQ